jgi:hypothetical protein
MKFKGPVRDFGSSLKNVQNEIKLYRMKGNTVLFEIILIYLAIVIFK